MRFEYYLTFLKNCEFIIGNSSSGITEAPYYGIPTINIGDRQKNRANLKSIINCNYKSNVILKHVKKFTNKKRFKRSYFFGLGNSQSKILKVLTMKKIWKLNNQKQFKEINLFNFK